MVKSFNFTTRQKQQKNSVELTQKILAWQNAKLALKKNNLHLARVILTDLHHNFPTDDIIARKYAYILKRQGLLDEAIDVLEHQQVMNPFYFKDLTGLYIRSENYEKAYQLCQSLSDDDISDIRLADLNGYYRCLKIFLHQFYPDVSLPLCFSGHFENLLLHYDENNALCHIKIRHDANCKVDDSLRGSLFSSNIDITELFKITQNSIHLEDRETSSQGLFDCYLYHYQSDEFNCMRVLTIPNTNQIITMYPLFVHRLDEARYLESTGEINKAFIKK